MLTKLLKYECKATAKTFGGIYLAMFGVAVFMGVSLRFSNSGGMLAQWNTAVSEIGIFGSNLALQLAVIGALCYFALVVAMFAVLTVSICQRFYKNLLGNEGYLMHTLPVTPAMLIISKMLVALLWSLLSILVLVGSLRLFVLVLALDYPVATSLMREYLSHLNWNITFFAGCLLTFGSGVGTLLSVYLAMLIGHNFKKGVVFVSIIAYFVINNVRSWMSMAILWVVQSTPLVHIANVLPDQADYVFAFLLQMAIAALYFFCAEYLLRKHLNLE